MICRREGRSLVVSGNTFPHRNVLGSLPGGRWNSQRKAWLYPATPVSAANLHRLGSIVTFDGDGAIELAATHTERTDRLDAVRGGDGLPGDLPEYLWRHQRAAVWVASVRAGHLLDFQMRSGKTLISLAVAKLCGYTRVLIVCPLKVVDTWAEENEKHDLGFKVVGLAAGSVAERLRTAERSWPAVYAINYEAVWRQPFGEWALKQPWDLVIADEVHKLAAAGGKASWWMKRLAERVDHRIGLSGTPLGDGPKGAYGIFRFIDPGLFGTSNAKFRARYVRTITIPHPSKEGETVDIPHPNPQMRDLDPEGFAQRYHSVTLRGERDAADVPEETDTTIHADLPPDARRVYGEMRANLITTIHQGTITAANALVKAGKLHQIATGHVKHEDGRVEHLHHEKDALLAEVLDELGPTEPLVVICRYVPDLARIHAVAEAARRECLEISGARNDLAAWKRGEGSMIAVQIRSGGSGVDLARTRHCVFWSVWYSHTDYEQARWRIKGQQDARRSVAFTHLVSRRTIDEGIYKALAGKKDFLSELLRAPGEVL